jgi:hypothetical protein
MSTRAPLAENPKYVVKLMLNTLLCDIRPSRGASMRLIDESAFDTEAEALKHYNERKTLNRFGAGSDAHVVCYPVFEPNYYPTPIPTSYCDECGEPIYTEEAGEDGTGADEGYTDLPNGNFCSKACFRNNFQDRSEDDSYDEDRYEDDY